MLEVIGGVLYSAIDDAWRAKGRAPLIAYVTPLEFPTWTPGDRMPIGHYDDPLRRNIGPRVQDLSELDPYYGDITIGLNQTVEGLDIFGKVLFSGKGNLVDCRVRGPVGSTNFDAAINATYNGRGSLIDHCMVDMHGRENVWADGIRGNNFVMRYTEIVRTVDGFGAVAGSYYGPTLIENSRLHDGYYTAWFDPTDTVTPPYNLYPGFPTSPGDRRTHNDGVQFQGWSGYTLRGNYIGGHRAPLGPNAPQVKQNNRDYLNPAHQPVIRAVDKADDFSNTAMMIQNNVSAAAMVGALIEKNWLAGGDAIVNLYAQNSFGDTLGGVILRNNRLIHQSQFVESDGYDGYGIYRTSNCTATITGNVWDDTGLPVNIVSY